MIEGEAPMYNDLTLFRLASAKAEYAAHRQTVTAQNMAQADTPGYKARDLPPFSEIYGAPRAELGLRVSHPAHFRQAAHSPELRPRPEILPGTATPNGNTVSLETEMIRASEIQRDHNLALTVYGSGLKLLRTAIGK
ncbi:MAG: FlgB family protein [Mangrovicoccus sp.]|nr:FlgB family protein [Mangrovicoccus sp.]